MILNRQIQAGESFEFIGEPKRRIFVRRQDDEMEMVVHQDGSEISVRADVIIPTARVCSVLLHHEQTDIPARTRIRLRSTSHFGRHYRDEGRSTVCKDAQLSWTLQDLVRTGSRYAAGDFFGVIYEELAVVQAGEYFDVCVLAER